MERKKLHVLPDTYIEYYIYKCKLMHFIIFNLKNFWGMI